MKPGRQRLLIPGLLVALLLVVAVVAGIRQAHATPTPHVPLARTFQVSLIDDSRVTESSGLAASTAHPGLAYTVNDSGDDPRIFAIDIATGRVVGVTSVVDAQWRDAEALALRDGKLWLADTGNNLLVRADPALYVLDEPGPGTQRLAATRYPVDLGSLTADVEAIAVLPDRVDLYVKGFPAGYTLELIGSLRADEPNRARKTNRTVPPFATDATATADGQHVLIRNSALVEIRDATTWRLVHRDLTPAMAQAETITLEAGEWSYLIGSEGPRSPLLRVEFRPSEWGDDPVPYLDQPAQMRAQSPVRLFVWEHRRQLAGGAVLAVLATGVLLVVWRRRARRRTSGESKENR
jgi:hypothetical protein